MMKFTPINKSIMATKQTSLNHFGTISKKDQIYVYAPIARNISSVKCFNLAKMAYLNPYNFTKKDHR